MENEVKRWKVAYSHADGRSGEVEVTTEVQKSAGFQYGNGKCGGLTVEDYTTGYDLRYEHGDLHRLMLESYFGNGLVEATELI